VFVAENNGYAEATSRKFAVGAESIAGRAASFGMPALTVDGHDFFAVYEATNEAVARARRGEGPAFIECQVNRYYGHFEGDAQTYRAPNEAQKIRDTQDCIVGFISNVVGGGQVAQSDLDLIDKEIAVLIDSAVDAAKADPKPTETDLLTDVYVTY
jgi:pyruvate dehydrogenase E1 component alpha subunit